jgi:hypothetical protein
VTEELPDITQASDEDLHLVMSALPRELVHYGGFLNTCLAGVYAERERAQRRLAAWVDRYRHHDGTLTYDELVDAFDQLSKA